MANNSHDSPMVKYYEQGNDIPMLIIPQYVHNNIDHEYTKELEEADL